jgi:hypothetical protein
LPVVAIAGGSSPYSTRQGYFAELVRGLSHASPAHKNPIKVAVIVTRADGRSKTQRLRRAGRPRSPLRRDRPGQTTPGQAHYEIWSGQPSLEVKKPLHCR